MTPEEIKALQTENQTLKDAIATYEANKKAYEEKQEELKLENEGLSSLNKNLQEQVQKLSSEKTAQDFVSEIEAVKEVTIEGKEVTVNKVTYGFNFPKQVFEGKPITADDVVADASLAKKLVEAKSSMLKAL
jgi:chromosome segregation ATPase